MSIQIIPYKLTHGELEARLAPGLSLLPGQLLRFEGSIPVYGQVMEVNTLPDAVAGSPEGQTARISLLRGSPSLQPAIVTPLTTRQMVYEVVKLLPRPEQPLDLEAFQADYLRLGALTLVAGDNFLLKYQALLGLMEAVKPYQKILVLDPVGIFESVGDLTCYTAGKEVRLGLQQVSGKRFLEAFGGLFPEGVRKPVMETVASHWPESGSFSGFSPLLVSGMITESLLKNLILQNCAHVIRNKLFAEAPDQVLDLKKLSENAVSVLDLSGLQEPWKSFFYQEVMAQVFALPELGLVPVLIYPENYLPDLPMWVKKADESGFCLLALASPYVNQNIQTLANNTVTVASGQAATLRGDLTLGLPVAFGSEEVEPQAEWVPAEPESLPAEPMINPVERPHEPAPVAFAAEAEEEAVEWTELFEEALTEAHPEPVVGIQPPESADEPRQFFSSWQQVEVEETEPDTEAFEPSSPELGIDQAEEEAPEESLPLEIPAEEPFAAEALPPLSFTTPVVDLSSPGLEAIPSFLTAEQLSDLLNAPTLSLEAEPEEDPLDYPDAEEGAMPEDMGDVSNFPLPMAVGPPTIIEVAPTAETLPAAPVPESVLPSLSAPLPSFPAPEAFGKDEFDFDINLDQKVDQLYEPAIMPDPTQGEGGLGVAISKSLNDFDDLSRAPQAPLLDFDAEPLVQKLAQPQKTPTQAAPDELEDSPEPSEAVEEPFHFPMSDAEPEGKHPESRGKGASDRDMQDALDTIYPRQFESPEAEKPLAASASPSWEEADSVPVIKKKQETSREGAPGFKAGDKVRHPNYGLGIVQKVIPIDQSVVLNITFENVGKRLLDPALTALSLEAAS